MKIKSIGTIWATEKTIEKTSLKDCIVKKLEKENCKQSPVLLQINEVEYSVYGKNKNEYKQLIEKIKTGLNRKNNYEI